MSLRSALLLLVLLAQAASAQKAVDTADLPQGIEATGDTAEVRALTAWAGEHRHSHPEQAEQTAQRALALARELEDQPGISRNLTTLGNIFLQSNPQQAYNYYLAAQEALEQTGDEHGLIRNRFHIGNVRREQGELERALSAYFDALEGFERLGDIKGQIGVLNNLGIVHQNQNNLEKALVYYERAVSLAETLDSPFHIIGTLNNLSGIHWEQGSYEKAELVLRRALDISENQGDKYLTASITNNLGALFNKQNRHEQALPHLFTAENLIRELEKDGLMFSINNELGTAYLGLERYERALYYAGESLTVAKKMESVSNQMVAHQTLSQIYEAAGDDGQALAHYRQYAAARDSAFTAEKAEIVTEMQTRYETEEKQRAIERLEYENRIRLILFLAGVGGLLLLLGFLYNRYRLKQKANHLLEELDAAKSRFFANISHEFRTPLTVILGSVQDMIAGRFDGSKEKVSEQQHAILRNSRQLQRLVAEVLDLNRLEAGKLELHPTPGDLVRSLRHIVEADAPLAERNGIDLTFEHNVEHCPRLYDQEKLEKIVGNLLSNALKFTPKDGSVRVSLNGGQETEIIVSDDGPGIPAEMHEKVFERFAQVKDGALHGGTGIGLALAKELAELHGGTITLESETGEGSTFTVRLPLEKTTLDEIEAPLQQNTEALLPEEFDVSGDGHERRQDVGATLVVAQQTEETNNDPDRTTVLIIEDNDDVRAFVLRSLEETYRVFEAADGETGLQQARSELPDLIISDVMLPGIDGYEVAKRLKAEAETECIPVVMLTARAAEEDQTEGYGSGAEVYLTKPFSPETLRAACARLLEERMRLRRRLQEETGQMIGKERENGPPTLVDRTRAAILENLHDEDFGVEQLASALGMSRYTLHRHLKEEDDRSPSYIMRTLRLKRAHELLSNGAGSVSEVAYAVGFKSLSHFTHSFQKHHRELPSKVLGKQVEN